MKNIILETAPKSDSTTLTIRLNQSVKDRLNKAAQHQRRSKTFIAVEAIQEYLAVQDWQEKRIREALAAADRGEVVSHETVSKWVDSLNSDNEQPLPKA